MPGWADKTSEMIADASQIRGFVGECRWLSNFHPCPVRHGGLVYGNAEEAYQAAKFPQELRPQFQGIGAFQSKKKAQALLVGALPEARRAWDDAKEGVMREIVWAKFSQNADLARLLIETGPAYL